MPHNGGRTQTQGWYLYTASDWPFTNLVKMCANDWLDTGGGNANNPVDPSIRDSNGYPTSGAYYAQCLVPVGRTNSYVMYWTGTGSPRLGQFGTRTGGSTFPATNGRTTFTIDTSLVRSR